MGGFGRGNVAAMAGQKKHGFSSSGSSDGSTQAPQKKNGGCSSGSSDGSSQDKSASEKGQRRTCLQNQLHKTKFCMYHLKGACQYGRECAFAHAYSELQATPDLRKTRLCTAFFEGDGCTNARCPFAHGEEELRSTDMFYKKTLCIWNEKGRCRNGDQCRFAHGMAELRNGQGLAALEQLERAAAPSPGGAFAADGGGKQLAQERKAKGGPKKGVNGATDANVRPQEVRGLARATVASGAEPMKIMPTRSLVEAPGLGCALPPPLDLPAGLEAQALAALQQQALAAGLGEFKDERLHSEITRLRSVITALIGQCSAIEHNRYQQPPQFDGPQTVGGTGAFQARFPAMAWPRSDSFAPWQASGVESYIGNLDHQ